MRRMTFLVTAARSLSGHGLRVVELNGSNSYGSVGSKRRDMSPAVEMGTKIVSENLQRNDP